MANEAVNKGIKNSWSFVAFAKMTGKPKLAKDQVNKETGEKFDSIAFIDNNDNIKCFVSFSSKLGSMSAEDIAAQKDNLQVVELESGTYKLCKAGVNTWQDIDLGI